MPGNRFEIATAFRIAFSAKVAPVSSISGTSGSADKSRTANSLPRISENSRVLCGLRVARVREFTWTGFTGLTGLEFEAARKKPTPVNPLNPVFFLFDEGAPQTVSIRSPRAEMADDLG